MPEIKKTTEVKTKETVSFKGRFINAVGRRKTSIAQVRLYQNGKGIIIINDKKVSEYFPENVGQIVSQPLKLTGNIKDYNITVHVSGGGIKGQADAVKHGISRALLKLNAELRPLLKTKGLLTRDARKKERKKPGLKKARRAPQWSKR